MAEQGVFWAWHRDGMHGSLSSSADTLESEETIGTGSSRGQRGASLPETLAQQRAEDRGAKLREENVWAAHRLVALPVCVLRAAPRDPRW